MQFEEPSVARDNPSDIFGYEERWTQCPDCSSCDIAAKTPCSVCGESAVCEYGLCAECRRAALEFFKLYLGRWFTRNEVRFLSDWYGAMDMTEGVDFHI